MRSMIDLENTYQKQQAARRRQAELAACRVRPHDVIQQDPVEELERVLSSLEENHKLPRHVVLTRWLSSDDAIWVILNSRLVYTHYFSNEENETASGILEQLEDSAIFAWFACLRDVIPV
jgi:hypothetical protein